MKSNKQTWLYPLSLGVTIALGAMTSVKAADLGIEYLSGDTLDAGSNTTLGYVFKALSDPNGNNIQVSGLGVIATSTDINGKPVLQTDRIVTLWENEAGYNPSLPPQFTNSGTQIAQVTVPQIPNGDTYTQNSFVFAPIKNQNNSITLIAGNYYTLGVFYADGFSGDKLFTPDVDFSNLLEFPGGIQSFVPVDSFGDPILGVTAFPNFPTTFPFNPTLDGRLTGNLLLGENYPTNPTTSTTASFSIIPPSQTTFVGDQFFTDIQISGLGNNTAPSLKGYTLNLDYDKTLLSLSNLVFGDPNRSGQDLINPNGNQGNNNPGSSTPTGQGNISQSSTSLPSQLNDVQPSSFIVARAFFNALGTGTSPITFSNVTAQDQNNNPITFSPANRNGSVTILPASAKVPEPNISGLAFGLTVGLGVLMTRRKSV